MAKTIGAEWTDFCWHGVSVDVPADWELGAASGTADSGYIRLDDTDMVRLEMRWEKSKRKLTAKDVVTNHLKQAEKEAKQARQKVRSKRDISFVKLDGVDYECFSFDAEYQSFGMVRRCEECQRSVFIRVMYRKGDSIRAAAKRIFRSLRDHPSGDTVRWHFFDLEFETPCEAELKERSLKTGCLEMLFKRGRDELEFARVSLAEMQLQKKSLKSWFEEFYSKRLRAYRASCEEEEFRGHESLVYTGKARLLYPIVTLLRIRRDLWARVWHCPESDKLYVYRVTAKPAETPELAAFADRIDCH